MCSYHIFSATKSTFAVTSCPTAGKDQNSSLIWLSKLGERLLCIGQKLFQKSVIKGMISRMSLAYPRPSLHIQYHEGQHSNNKIILCLGQNTALLFWWKTYRIRDILFYNFSVRTINNYSILKMKEDRHSIQQNVSVYCRTHQYIQLNFMVCTGYPTVLEQIPKDMIKTCFNEYSYGSPQRLLQE